MIKKIIGPPGTGKTTTLLSEILESGIPWDKILFVSLTNAAIKEAKSRALERGASEKQLVYFKTQHAMNRLLLGLDTDQLVINHLDEFITKYRYRFSEAAKKTDERAIFDAGPSEKVDDFLFHVHNKARNLRVDWTELVEKQRSLLSYRHSIGVFIDRYETWKKENGYFDFIDLISQGIKEEVCPPVELAVIDEFQDSSPLMAEQILLWSKRIPKMIIGGDHNQALYEFMGTKPQVFKDFPADETIVLEQSHRVPESIARFALRIINKNKGEESFFFRGAPKPGAVIEAPSLRHVVREITRLKDKTFMLLARDNFNLSSAKNFLREAGVPCDSSQKKTQAVALLLRRPKILTRYDMETLITELFPSKKSVSGAGAWERGAKTKIEKLFKEGFSPIETERLHEIGADQSLIDALRTGSLSILKMHGSEIRYYKNIVENWSERPDVVRSFTLHGSKGREADIAILLCDITKRTYDEERSGNIDSERRNWYVACTRAKELVILVRRQGNYGTRII